MWTRSDLIIWDAPKKGRFLYLALLFFSDRYRGMGNIQRQQDRNWKTKFLFPSMAAVTMMDSGICRFSLFRSSTGADFRFVPTLDTWIGRFIIFRDGRNRKSGYSGRWNGSLLSFGTTRDPLHDRVRPLQDDWIDRWEPFISDILNDQFFPHFGGNREWPTSAVNTWRADESPEPKYYFQLAKKLNFHHICNVFFCSERFSSPEVN